MESVELVICLQYIYIGGRFRGQKQIETSFCVFPSRFEIVDISLNYIFRIFLGEAVLLVTV